MAAPASAHRHRHGGSGEQATDRVGASAVALLPRGSSQSMRRRPALLGASLVGRLGSQEHGGPACSASCGLGSLPGARWVFRCTKLHLSILLKSSLMIRIQIIR